MPIADLSTPSGRIHSALEKLQESWLNTREHWDDANSRHLDEEVMVPLAMTVRLTLDAVGRMAESLIHAEAVCADDWRNRDSSV